MWERAVAFDPCGATLAVGVPLQGARIYCRDSGRRLTSFQTRCRAQVIGSGGSGQSRIAIDLGENAREAVKFGIAKTHRCPGSFLTAILAIRRYAVAI